jgi:Pentapeptide repeats (8 copies)
MANPEHVQLVRQGAAAIRAWWEEHPAEMLDLAGADLHEARLEGADLREARLMDAHLAGAHLREARLEGALLHGADLVGALLMDARLEGAHLWGAHLRRAYLTGANLQQASLQEACLIGADLDGANITDACLWETQRAYWSIRAVVCEAVYWDSHRQERTIYAPGEFERLFADKTKIVLHYEGGIEPIEVATLPALIQQMEARYPGCVLRLRSIEEAPGGAIVTLIIECRGADNLAEITTMKAELEGLGQRLISEERKALEAETQHQQAQHTLRFLSDEFFPRLLKRVQPQPKYSISIRGGSPMIGDTQGDTYNNRGQVGIMGPHTHAHDMTFTQLWSQSEQSIDLPALAPQLATLRQHLRQAAVEPDHDVAIGAVAEAEKAAKAGNGPKVLEQLSKAGRWALDNAEKIGVGVATAALKTALDL